MSSFKGQDQQSKCRKISCMDQIKAAFDSIWLETSFKDEVHFSSKTISTDTYISVVQSIESRVKVQVKCETTLENDHYQSLIDFIS